MKAYNLNAISHQLSFGELVAIPLGEEGRGRSLTLIPCPEGIGNGEEVSLAETRSGKPRVNRATTPSQGWVARLSYLCGYRRGNSGNLRTTDPQNVTVLATGQWAWGAAGRVGSGTDYLLKIGPGITRFRIRRSGHGDPYFLVFTDEEVFTLERSEVDAFVDAFGIDMPSEYVRCPKEHDPDRKTCWDCGIYDDTIDYGVIVNPEYVSL